MVDERSDVDSDGAGLLARAVCAFHASGCLGDGLFFRVNPVVEVSSPVVEEFGLLNTLEFDFVLFSVFLSSLGIDNLGFVEMRGRTQNVFSNFLRVFCNGKGVRVEFC